MLRLRNKNLCKTEKLGVLELGFIELNLVWVYAHLLTFYLHQSNYFVLEDQLFAGTKKILVLFMFYIPCCLAYITVCS